MPHCLMFWYCRYRRNAEALQRRRRRPYVDGFAPIVTGSHGHRSEGTVSRASSIRWFACVAISRAGLMPLGMGTEDTRAVVLGAGA
jgi:hypothetical protein